jgi:ABC-type Fe3+ transport system permease subunit
LSDVVEDEKKREPIIRCCWCWWCCCCVVVVVGVIVDVGAVVVDVSGVSGVGFTMRLLWGGYGNYHIVGVRGGGFTIRFVGMHVCGN